MAALAVAAAAPMADADDRRDDRWRDRAGHESRGPRHESPRFNRPPHDSPRYDNFQRRSDDLYRKWEWRDERRRDRGYDRAYDQGYRDGFRDARPKWAKGQRLGPARYVVVSDHRRRGWRAPQRGEAYLRVDQDILLVALGTGLILDVMGR
jgi:Ni/Co efflux regulator RcnB